MGNSVKFSESIEEKSLKSGKFYLGTGDVPKGPTNETGFWNSIIPPEGGYTIYFEKEENGPSIYVCEDDFSLINLTNLVLSTTFSTVEECLDYYKNDLNSFCANREYEPTITDGLVLNLDSGFSPSLRPGSDVWKNLSGDNSAQLSGGYKINNLKGGNIFFDGLSGKGTIDLTYVSNIYSISLWFKLEDDITSTVTLLSSDKFNISISNSNLQIGINSQNYSINYQFIDDNWYFISLSKRDDKFIVYINDENFEFSSTQNIEGGVFNIACSNNNSNFFKGNITNIMIYNTLLNDSEILFNYNNHKSRTLFHTVWDTRNLSEGSSLSNQISLPLISNGTYKMLVDWGDGTNSQINTFDDVNRTHTYQEPGLYEVKISGICNGFRFNNTGDKLKILEIKNWGVLKIISDSSFFGCANLDVKTVDSPEIKTNDISSTFKDCVSFVGNNSINKWDVEEVEIADEVFTNSSINVSLESWKPKSANSLRALFKNSGLSSKKYTRTISKWAEVIKENQVINNITVDLSDQSGMLFDKSAEIITKDFESTLEVREFIESSQSIIVPNDTIIDTSISNFILSSGFWNDAGVWEDNSVWID